MKEKNEENEIINPIKKEVKRPIMKAISMIAIPLTIFFTLVVILIYWSFYTEVYRGASVTAQEWKEYMTASKTSVGSYAGCSNYEEYKDNVWEEQGYSEIPFVPIVIVLIGLGTLGIIARKSYKEGQEEE